MVPPAELAIRAAEPGDAEAMARIFTEGVADRVATFETRPADADQIRAQLASGLLTLVAVEGSEVIAWAKVGGYSDEHDYYAGIGEATLYVARARRSGGAGGRLLDALAGAAEARGYYKLVGKIFSTNSASIALVRRCGWSEVGVHRRHGRLDGEWKDVLVVEKLLGEAAGS